MKNKPDIQRVLDRWFEEGPTAAPDRVLDAALATIDTTKQRRVWGVSWRYSTMSNFGKMAVAGVLVLALGGLALVLADLGGDPPIGAASQSPHSSEPLQASASPQATVSPPRPAGWSATGSMTTPRELHTATLLRDGRVLVVGGNVHIGLLDSAELYDPITGKWSATGSLNTAREHHTATLLKDGRVLVAGGYSQPDALASAELYDPRTGTWSITGSMTTPRAFQTATLLADGRVLVVGGDNFASDTDAVLASAEVYDPSSGTWSVTGSLTTPRKLHTATRLEDGKILVAGGDSSATGATGARETLTSAEVYDPSSGTWSVTGSLTTARTSHTATLLVDGRVLVAGGHGNSDTDILASAELYDLSTGTWSVTGGMLDARSGHTGRLLTNGKVLVIGGPDPNDPGDYLGSAELYDPGTGVWGATASMIAARGWNTATVLADGTVLVAGGLRSSPIDALDSAELYDPGVGN